MKTFDYTLNTTQQSSTATVDTLTQNLTGTTDVTFSLSGIDQTESPVDKVIVTFTENDKEIVFNRDLSTTTDSKSLSAVTFTEVLDNDIIDLGRPNEVEILLHRDDGITDLYTIVFRMYASQLDSYTDINLIKSDFIDTNNSQDNVLLTFEAEDPGLVGTSLLSANTDEYLFYGSGTTETSSCSTEVGFQDEFDFVAAALSHGIFNVEADGCSENGFKLKFRTRTGIGTANYPGVGYFNPAIPNSQFIHVSGFLDFYPTDVTRVKNINVPLLDIKGSNLKPNVVYQLENVATGIGTSLTPLSGGYFFIDLYDIDGCETVTLGTSTLTAYITY